MPLARVILLLLSFAARKAERADGMSMNPARRWWLKKAGNRRGE